MTRRPRFARGLTILAATLLAPATILAQSTIAGTVTDPEGKPIAGATVTISKLLEPHLRFTVETSEDGNYTLENFNPSRGYQFSVAKDGFRTFATNVEVGLASTITGTTLRQDFTLYPAGSASPDEPRLLLLNRRSPGQQQYQRGAQALEDGQLNKARSHFERARELDPELEPVDEALAMIYHRLGEHDAALEAAETVLEKKPGDPYYLRLRYEALHGLGRPEEARAVLMEVGRAAAGTADPEIGRLFFNEGLRAARGSDLELAESMLEAALRLEPDLVEARRALAKVLIQLGKHESAAVTAEAVLDLEPENVEMLRVRHQGYAGLGETERARGALRDLVRHDPGPRTATLLYNQGVSAFNASDDETAEEVFAQAVASDPQNLQARIGLAEVYLRQRRFELCLATVEEILAVDDDNPAALRIGQRARAWMGQG